MSNTFKSYLKRKSKNQWRISTVAAIVACVFLFLSNNDRNFWFWVIAFFMAFIVSYLACFIIDIIFYFLIPSNK